MAEYIRKDSQTARPHCTWSSGHQERVEVHALFDFTQYHLKSVGEIIDQAVKGRERRTNRYRMKVHYPVLYCFFRFTSASIPSIFIACHGQSWRSVSSLKCVSINSCTRRDSSSEIVDILSLRRACWKTRNLTDAGSWFGSRWPYELTAVSSPLVKLDHLFQSSV